MFDEQEKTQDFELDFGNDADSPDVSPEGQDTEDKRESDVVPKGQYDHLLSKMGEMGNELGALRKQFKENANSGDGANLERMDSAQLKGVYEKQLKAVQGMKPGDDGYTEAWEKIDTINRMRSAKSYDEAYTAQEVNRHNSETWSSYSAKLSDRGISLTEDELASVQEYASKRLGDDKGRIDGAGFESALVGVVGPDRYAAFIRADAKLEAHADLSRAAETDIPRVNGANAAPQSKVKLTPKGFAALPSAERARVLKHSTLEEQNRLLSSLKELVE